WVYIAPVSFRLRMDLRVTINFRSRSLQNARMYPLGQTKHIDGAHHVGLDRLYRIVLIVNRRCRTREVINLIDFKENWLDHIVTRQIKPMIVEQMCNVLPPSCKEIYEI